MTLSPVACRRTVAVIGPKFGTASQAIDKAIRNHHGDENVESLWYEEAEFERKLGKFLGRVVRLFTQALPLPQKVRSASEWFVGTVRFRRIDSVSGQLAFARSIAPIHHLVLVKPMFLRRRDLDELRQTSGATTVSIVLWDALWRTPSIGYLLSGGRVFSTEPADCQTFGFTALPVPTLEMLEPFELNNASSESVVRDGKPGLGSSNSEQPIRVFFCGSWSIDRWLAARKLISEIHRLEKDSLTARSKSSDNHQFDLDIYLVTTNSAVGWFTKISGLKTTAIDEHTYSQFVAQCDVLLDLGRSGQSSPSERIAAAIEHGKIILSTNPFLSGIGFPFVSVETEGWGKALLRCKMAVTEGTLIKRCWDSNTTAQSFTVTLEDWANQIFRTHQAATRTYESPSGEQRVAFN